MKWIISSEIVAAIMLCIILVYARKGNLLPTFKNIAFQYCLVITFVSVITNICSTLLLEYVQQVPFALNMALLVVYFLSTPLMGVVYFVYTLANVYEKDKEKILYYAKLASIPAIIYIVSVLLNPFTNDLFYFDTVSGYHRGPWISLTYVVFYVYVLLSIVIVWRHRQNMDKTVCYILGVFPFISSLVILFQFFYPSYILTGTAATSALLIIYLYLQNKQMFTDTLTSLLNRQEFNKMMDIKVKDRHSFSVIVLSLQDFKFINDKFGQEIGDKILLQICHYLKQFLPKQALYRYGGDEFAVIFDNEEQMKSLMKDIVARMSNPWIVSDMELLLHYVIGAILYPDVASTREEIIQGLEYAVMSAKQDKEGNVCFCTNDMMAKLQRSYEIITILKQAIDQNSFQVYFQPIYDVQKKKYRKAEALLRLPENHLGFVSPEEFIPLAEEKGLIGPITYQVLNKTCKFVRELINHEVEFVGVSVNFSIIQFMQEDLEQRVVEIIEQNKIPFDKIKIEITESMLAVNYALVLDFMQKMTKRGVQFLLDDFGTGYSNISYVLSVPFHTVKLDKSLIWMAMKDENAAKVLEKICEAFIGIGRHVLAEGIETKEHIAFVKACGCEYLQGYYYARPVPADQALHIIEHTIIASKTS